MNIEQDVLAQLNITRCSVAQSFFSRRNSVYLMRGKREGAEIKFVFKIYRAGDIEKEYRYLSRLNGINVPAVLARGERSLCLEYIKGDTLLERLEQCELGGEPFSGYIDALIRFLTSFYAALPGHMYGDVNLRNFIVAEDGVYGVDLEEAGPGNTAVDIGRAAAFILTYDPAGTDYKKKAADYLAKAAALAFGLDRGDIEREKQKELEAMSARRRRADEKGV